MKKNITDAGGEEQDALPPWGYWFIRELENFRKWWHHSGATAVVVMMTIYGGYHSIPSETFLGVPGEKITPAIAPSREYVTESDTGRSTRAPRGYVDHETSSSQEVWKLDGKLAMVRVYREFSDGRLLDEHHLLLGWYLTEESSRMAPLIDATFVPDYRDLTADEVKRAVRP